MNAPETRYAKTADGIHVAYQVLGGGPVDVVFVMGWTSNIEAMWEEPNLRGFLTRLSSFSRLILFDKRGVGLSDRVPEDRLPSLETRMDDVRAVMDTAGSERAIVFGVSEGGPMSLLFAATYPERTIGLILFGTAADFTRRELTYRKDLSAYLEYMDRSWGTVDHARDAIREWGAPSHADDEALVQWLASYLRRAASPGAAIALQRMNNQINVSDALSAICVPTLVIGRTGDLDFPIEDTKAMARRISGAQFVELPGDSHFFWVDDWEPILDEVERFVSSTGHAETAFDRMLTTILFTDIVDSTAQTVTLGDARWHEIQKRHDELVHAQLSRFRGKLVRSTGDGILATFDGPARAVHCARAIIESVGSLGI
ncbi:MAG: alpha/beta fold hydrolase, partial [Rhodothermales bacterium]|nr:alpha/beta fold hydrolase [Rhodothermales bacterium]